MIARTSALALAALVGLGAIAAAPADAQRRQRVVEVFGNDPAPEPQGDEIIIIARKPESDRFRIPTELRGVSQTDATTKSSRVDEMVSLGRTGTDSCSAVGPGGFTGCFMRDVQNNRTEKRSVARAKQEEPR